jgi:hypothetical protein
VIDKFVFSIYSLAVLEFQPGVQMTNLYFISGAAGGLGKAFAVECASRGWDLFLTDMRPEPLEALAAALKNTYGVRIIYHALDLTDLIAPACSIDIGRVKLRHDCCRFDMRAYHRSKQYRNSSILRVNIEATLIDPFLLQFRNKLCPFGSSTSPVRLHFSMPVRRPMPPPNASS